MAKKVRVDKELEEFRSQMEVPSTFEEGFTWTSLVAALFIAMLMVPGAMYMRLLAGIGVGPAAQWVTVILFIEVARRAHKHLPRAEVFVLFYMASAVVAQPFSGLLFNQFLVQSRAATGMGIAQGIPAWYAPNDPDILANRNFLSAAWLPAIALIAFQMLMGRLNSSVLSYGFFRLASDIEKLPFPMAPVGAQGVMALVEQQVEEGAAKKVQAESWRWRVFSIGGILGLSFGALYMGLPAVTSALFGKPIIIFPIPFVDWTQKTAELLPAVATGMSLNLGQMVVGMVLPFYAMVGSFVGTVCIVIANPILYSTGVLTSWEMGDDTVKTLFKNNIDFYFSFGIGLSLALAIVGITQVIRGFKNRAKDAARKKNTMQVDEQLNNMKNKRGDLPASVVIGVYIITSATYIMLSGWLVDWHRGVMTVLVFFAYFYTPIISYVTTRLEGMAGQVVQIPFVREAAFILSGYTGGVKIWFMPLPLADYGRRTVFWRQTELTGTKFWSIWKTELVLIPIVLMASILFAQFIWSLAPIPGPEYPYTERMWELMAANKCIIFSSTLGRYSTFEQAFRPLYLFIGTGVGISLFTVLGLLSAPTMMIYGLVRGLNQTLPHVVITQFIGAVIGRFYFQRRLGKQWRKYIPVVAAGFSCGMGLITVFAVGLNFLAKSVIKIPF
ncbi:MAG: peptide transporter [Kiritimatiellae bacterium]|nr:peptide transporter [Kiritimatiellia bacterium]